MARTGRGRRTKALRRDIVDRIVEAIATGCTYEAAAAAGPISVRTFYEWMGRAETDQIERVENSPYIEFADRVEAANLEAELRITQLWVAAIPNDWRAARDFLERRFPSRWRRPETRQVAAVQTGGYTPLSSYLSDREREESVVRSIEAWLAAEMPPGDKAG